MPPVRLVAATLQFEDQIYSRLIESLHTGHPDAFKRVLAESARSNNRFGDLSAGNSFDQRDLL